MELIENPRYEDYDIVYRSRNVWSFLGNGFSLRDNDGRDLTYYMGLVDGEDRQRDYDVGVGDDHMAQSIEVANRQ